MALLPTDNSRPPIGQPYNAQPLPYMNQFRNLGDKPITAEHLDNEINYIIDRLNAISVASNAIVFQGIPGLDDIQNRNKMLSADGYGSLVYTFVNSSNILQNTITGGPYGNIALQTITADNINTGSITGSCIARTTITGGVSGNIGLSTITSSNIVIGSIIGSSLKDGAVTGDKIAIATIRDVNIAYKGLTGTNVIKDGSINTVCLANQSVTGDIIADDSIIEQHITDGAVTEAKISSAGATSGYSLMADGAGGAAFGLLKGTILQVQFYENDSYSRAESNFAATPTSPISFAYPFRFTFTPQKTGSTILIYYSINVGGNTTSSGSSFNINPLGIVFCKDNTIFKYGPNGSIQCSASPVSAYGSSELPMFNFTNILQDTGVQNTPIEYEIQKTYTETYLNCTYIANEANAQCLSTMCIVEIDV